MATAPQPDALRGWVAEQVDQYVALIPTYRVFAEVLDRVLRRAAADLAPLTIVQTRSKSVSSFAEKCLRKRAKRPDPVHQFTDLCGARLIARTRSEVEALCGFVVAHFDVDWEDSLDASDRLKPSEFGYRSVHYIVSFRTDVDYGEPIPEELLGLRAEIQARTMTEHAYSDFAHDLTYKGAFELPLGWRRELAGAAATLEEVDGVFDRVERGLREYASSYGRYLSDKDLGDEIARLEIVLEHDPANADLADRLARLALARGDWEKVVAALSPLVAQDPTKAPVPAQRDLGIALCQLHRSAPGGADYRSGQDLLARAGDAGDVDALCAYAGTWKGVDEHRALDLYRRAFEIDPTNSYALGNFVEMQLERDPNVLDSVRPLLRQSIARCGRQVTAGINLPWALYDLCRFHLLLDEPYEALEHLAEALTHSSAAWMLQTSLASVERLARLRDGAGAEWASRLLILGLASRFDDRDAFARVRELATPGRPPLSGPAVVVAGGTHTRVQGLMDTYGDLLRSALADVTGVVLSGGTTQGIAGIVGDVGRARGASMQTVGYLPELIPADATRDEDYDEIRTTSGRGFSPLEPLQSWIDLVAGGVRPDTVRVLGVNGGRIAATEYRIALSLGATVGLVADSGREAGRLLGNERWTATRLVRLPADAETLRAFLTPPADPLPDDVREDLARSIHEAYREERRRDALPTGLAALQDWDRLPDDLRASNVAQADSIGAKLARISCVIVPADSPDAETAPFTETEVALLARVEHGRWTAERLVQGWTWGPDPDAELRRSPYLVDWRSLPDDIKNRDREAVCAIPKLLASVGLGFSRVRPPAD